ncbi:MAG TPA: hypothetical protein DCR04_10530 [Flavobacteriales bacterium]|nr:hypothetical protein [Flavobacteriales bacterium]
MVNLRLSIADFVIDLINKSELPIKLEDGYSDFVLEESTATASVQVIAHAGIPDSLQPATKPIYSADFEGNKLWEIFRIEDGLLFHVYSSTEPYQLQQVAKLNADLTVWDIYSEPVLDDQKSVLFPLLYPMGPLVMYYLTAKFDAIMIHGSGISDNGLGRIFTGVSGQGKTTMAKLWFDAGAEVLNDDRLIIRNQNGTYQIYNTPMFYQDEQRSAELKAIYSIHHSKENTLIKTEGASAVAGVTPNLIQHGYTKDLISHHLKFVTQMIDTIPVYKLGVVPNNSVVEFIRDYDR